MRKFYLFLFFSLAVLAGCTDSPVAPETTQSSDALDLSGTYSGRLAERADGTNITAQLTLVQVEHTLIGSGWWHVWRRNGRTAQGVVVDSLPLAKSQAALQGVVVDSTVSILVSLDWGTGNIHGKFRDGAIQGEIDGHDIFHLWKVEGFRMTKM